MTRDSLLDFFEDFADRPDTFLVHDDGYRVRRMTYREVAAAARAFAARLEASGIRPDDKVVIWSENRTEWVVALWGCLLAGVVVVPVDYRASADLLTRIVAIVQAKALLIGAEVEPPAAMAIPIWKLEAVAAGPRGPSDTRTTPLGRRDPGPLGPTPITPQTLAEIIFTSGATADPKGVTITHRNVLANILPIEREVAKYRKYARPFHPIRFLNLLPLSHLFGQSMATFIPPMLSGTVVFSHGYSPAEILRQIKSRRVSVLVCVPKVLDVLREHVERVSPMTREADVLAGRHFAWRWWRYRAVHRLFGWKFWCLICGAAPLDPELEAFWRKLGFLVVQGYGLTETAPIVTLNHPFHASRGTVGKAIGGVEIRIAPDGEILVRGENVTSGYYVPEGQRGAAHAAADAGAAFEGGWFHTGDIGEMDAAGQLLIKGRKKEMIVTPQGLNVFPEDVERALLVEPGVKDTAVVGLRVNGEERIHAVLILEPGANVESIVAGANARLEDHQRVWSTSIWPGDALPRTEGTKKLKRRDIQRWAAGEIAGAASIAASTPRTVADIVSRYAAGRPITPETTLDTLGLSSLDRVELMMALEEAFQATLDETAIVGARTIAELEAMVHEGPRGPGSQGPGVPGSQGSRVPGFPGPRVQSDNAGEPVIAFPSWNRRWPAWFLRRISLPTWILPLGLVFMKMRVEGLDRLAATKGPVIFASNHQSHMDTPAILLALPARWRYRVAVAMAKEFFRAHFFPERFTTREWFTNSLNYYLACQFFNAFPLPQREAGTRETLRYIGEMTIDGQSILIFPEGKRSDAGVGHFMPGVAMISAKLGVPVVPVHIEGLDRVLHPTMRFPKRGPVRVAFGAPMPLEGDDYAALAQRVEDAVRNL